MKQSITLVLLHCIALPVMLVYATLRIFPGVLWLVFYPGYIANRGHHLRKYLGLVPWTITRLLKNVKENIEEELNKEKFK